MLIVIAIVFGVVLGFAISGIISLYFIADSAGSANPGFDSNSDIVMQKTINCETVKGNILIPVEDGEDADFIANFRCNEISDKLEQDCFDYFKDGKIKICNDTACTWYDDSTFALVEPTEHDDNFMLNIVLDDNHEVTVTLYDLFNR